MGDVSVRSLPLWMNFADSPVLRYTSPELLASLGKVTLSHSLGSALRFGIWEGRCAIESITSGLYTRDERFTDARIHGRVGEGRGRKRKPEMIFAASLQHQNCSSFAWHAPRQEYARCRWRDSARTPSYPYKSITHIPRY